MNTIKIAGKRYEIAFIFGNEVVVELPPHQRWGHQSRMPVKFSSLTRRQRQMLRKMQSTV